MRHQRSFTRPSQHRTNFASPLSGLGWLFTRTWRNRTWEIRSLFRLCLSDSLRRVGRRFPGCLQDPPQSSGDPSSTPAAGARAAIAQEMPSLGSVPTRRSESERQSFAYSLDVSHLRVLRAPGLRTGCGLPMPRPTDAGIFAAFHSAVELGRRCLDRPVRARRRSLAWQSGRRFCSAGSQQSA